ncbi:MAG: glutathione S-transferase family protein [Verrucomicrobiae bacterium]|nr:glutathione S-transferase family protein [Verrucomicrobiae bacterium]
MLTLVHFRLCPFSRSIRIALGELGLEAAFVEERAFEGRPEFLALNPAGELPVLQGPDGLLLCGALSIAEYLGEAARVGGPLQRLATSGLPLPPEAAQRAALELFPGTIEDRAEVRRLVDWFHRKLDREVTRDLLAEKVYSRLMANGGPHAPDADILRAVRANMRYHLRYISFLADQRRWLAGDDFSYADISGAAHLSVADYLGEIAWDDHPRAKVWYMRVKSRPSMRAVLADTSAWKLVQEEVRSLPQDMQLVISTPAIQAVA